MASDVDATIDFFTRCFGAEVVSDATVAGARNVFMRVGDGRLHLYDQPPRSTERSVVHHLGLQVDDLDSVIAHLKAEGVDVRGPKPTDAFGRYAMVEAPDRLLLEVFEVDADALPLELRTFFSMSGASNLDVVRSVFADWERGEFTARSWTPDPEIEYVRKDGPAPGRWNGLDEVTEGMREFLSAWDELRVEAEEYRELDDERVLVLVQLRGRAKTSGLDIAGLGTGGAMLFDVRERRVTRIVTYYDRARAIAEVGL